MIAYPHAEWHSSILQEIQNDTELDLGPRTLWYSQLRLEEIDGRLLPGSLMVFEREHRFGGGVGF